MMGMTDVTLTENFVERLANIAARAGEKDIEADLRSRLSTSPPEPVKFGAIVRDANGVAWRRTWFQGMPSWTNFENREDHAVVFWRFLKHPVEVEFPGIDNP